MTNITRKRFVKFIIVLFIIQIIFAIENISKAGFWSDIFSGGNKFLEDGKSTASEGQIVVGEDQSNGQNIVIETPKDSEVRKIISDIYSILFPLGVGITVIVGGVLGIKFMMASAEDKAKVKESLVPYIVGCVLIYATFGIWRLAIIIFSQLT